MLLQGKITSEKYVLTEEFEISIYERNHKTSTKVIERGGKQFLLWACTCGAQKELPFNSGIYIGARIESEKHYNEVMKQQNPLGAKNPKPLVNDGQDVEIDGETLCSAFACRNNALGCLMKEPTNSYCLIHLSALVRSSKRKPKILFSELVSNENRKRVLDGNFFESPTPRDAQLSTNRTKPVETIAIKAEKHDREFGTLTENVMELTKSSNQGRSTFKIWMTLMILASFGLMIWFSDYQGKNEAIDRLAQRNAYAIKCVQLSEEDSAAKAGPVGSVERINAVKRFYERLIKTECIEWGDGTILRNVFFEISNSSTLKNNLTNAIQYSLLRSNGIEPLTQRCADGWISPSIGKQGACSSHGGVVSGFLEKEEWRLSRFLSSGEWIYPPLSELIEEAKS